MLEVSRGTKRSLEYREESVQKRLCAQKVERVTTNTPWPHGEPMEVDPPPPFFHTVKVMETHEAEVSGLGNFHELFNR